MSQAMNESPASRKAVIWVVIVFLLGVAGGGMLGYTYAHRSVSAANAPSPEPERRARRVAELTQLLGLSSDQAKQLDAVILQGHTEARAVRDQADAQVDQIRQASRNKIRAILTPEQKPKYEEFLQKLDAERKRNAPR